MARNHITIPAGKIYLQTMTNGAYDPGERYVGDTPGATVAVDLKTTEILSSDDPTGERIAAVPWAIVRDFKFKAIEIQKFLIELFYGMEAAYGLDGPGSSGHPVTVTDEPFGPVYPLRSFQLGAKADFPSGVRGIGTLSVKQQGGQAGDIPDWMTIDKSLGRIDISNGIPTNMLNTTWLATYTSTTASFHWRTTQNLGNVSYAALRFIANNNWGLNRDIYFPLCTIMADGELTVKGARDGKNIEMGLKAMVVKPDDGRASIYIDGRPGINEFF